MTIDNPTFRKKSEVYGKAYEIYIKQGVIAYLVEQNFISRDDARLAEWKSTRVETIFKAVYDALSITDPFEKEITKHQLNHLAVCSILSGYTLTREYIKQIYPSIGKNRTSTLKLKAMWCPLTLPNDNSSYSEIVAKDRIPLIREFNIAPDKQANLFAKGRMGKADFILYLEDTKKKVDHLLVHEYSYEMPPKSPNFTEQSSHLNEFIRHRRLIEGRGVFANVNAEVEGETFDLSAEISQHLTALTGRDKPFYKLCQACAYVDDFVMVNDILDKDKPLKARAFAITMNGCESIGANYVKNITDTRTTLIKQLAEAYREHQGIADDDETAFEIKVNKLFESIRKKLPSVLSKQFRTLKDGPLNQLTTGQDYEYLFEETINSCGEDKRYFNTNHNFHIEEALSYIVKDELVDSYFNQDAKTAIGNIARSKTDDNHQISLRNLHASAVITALQSSQVGKLNLICLEGNPGIGKTTALKNYLGSDNSGFLFIYISPRVVINQDVSHDIANSKDGKSGILTLTSDYRMNKGAKAFYDEKLKDKEDNPRFISGAILADGVENLIPSMTDILVLTPEQVEEMNTTFSNDSLNVRQANEYEYYVTDKVTTGVWGGLASTTKQLLELNQNVNKVALTVAMQGYKSTPTGTTLDKLSKLFSESVNNSKVTPNARKILEERQKLAEKFSKIVVMVDELTGDGAGAPLVKDFIKWLNTEFIQPFTDFNQASPFNVNLVIADASLSNEVVMTKFLESGDENDEKIIISQANHTAPFALAYNQIKIAKKKYPAIHIMTNSFPSDSLNLRYKIKFTNIEPKLVDNELQSPTQAINDAKYEIAIENAHYEIKKAINEGSKQIIYFAQDKAFLRDVVSAIIEDDTIGLSRKTVAVIDADVPVLEKKKLLESHNRDKIKVFLMTSSASRGVSFPKCDQIIVAMPRFNVESSLMEIAQLIYRGRGFYTDENGNRQSGDSGKKTLTFLIENYLVNSEEEPFENKRRWVNQSIDIMSLIVMLRATVFSRVTGGAGLKQHLALVPVGKIGIENILIKITDSVSTFVKKGKVALSNRLSDENYGLLSNALQNVEELFSDFNINGIGKKDADNRSYTNIKTSNELKNFLNHERQSLLLPSNPDLPLIPSHVYISGITTLENFEHLTVDESYNFLNISLNNSEKMTILLNQLYRISKNHHDFNNDLKDSASNLFKLLCQDDNTGEFSIIKKLKTAKIWVAYPTDYNRFMQTKDENHAFLLQDSESWHSLLASEIGARAGIMPAIPKYRSQPFVAKSSSLNPINFNQIFDDKYFALSNTFNLLNTMLLNNQ